jgi:hypothetical protein
VVSRHSNARWLPYTLLDEIFALLAERISEGEEQGQDKMEESRLKELKELKVQLDRDIRLYMESVERESIFGSKRQ